MHFLIIKPCSVSDFFFYTVILSVSRGLCDLSGQVSFVFTWLWGVSHKLGEDVYIAASSEQMPSFKSKQTVGTLGQWWGTRVALHFMMGLGFAWGGVPLMKNLPGSDVTRQAWLEILSYSAASGFKPFKDASVFSTTHYFWYFFGLAFVNLKAQGYLAHHDRCWVYCGYINLGICRPLCLEFNLTVNFFFFHFLLSYDSCSSVLMLSSC